MEDAEVKYSDEGDAEFFLKEVLPEDSGVYTCIAENSVKKASSSCKVLIKSKIFQLVITRNLSLMGFYF